ncbi:MAG: fibrobacter succinogenes major paralogous domain-containing protein [Bacteroidales bacterium]|jgi:uncharacterized protein (TIGR02145 family)|nr:fibrobacter succinogenes major paralogous domain-containing protein [Bacteroidales bacterium]
MKPQKLFQLGILSVLLLLYACPEIEKEMLVSTGTVSNIRITSAEVSGTIVDLGSTGVSDHGHCWSLAAEPTLSNQKTGLGVPKGVGGFKSELTGLEAGKTYHVRAYARSEDEVKYGEDITFQTHAGFIVSTTTLSSVTSVTAQGGGTIVDDGGMTVTSCGVCWGTSAGPTVSGSHTDEGTPSGSFTSTLTGLTSGTIYYFRAYATNSSGTVYGNELSFITPVTDIEGNIYKTVKIGTQVWMAENLRTTHYRDNFEIPNITGTSDWNNPPDSWKGAYCDYNNVVNNTYGKLYNGYAVLNSRKLCPTGWHIPLTNDWLTLINHLGGYYEAGGRLKEAGTAHWKSPNTGTNESGFTALPGGYRWYDGVFNSFTEMAVFWCETPPDPNPGLLHFGLFQNNAVMSEGASMNEGNSLRCIKD